jgi:Icc-related predicted phosphoesterase
MGFATLVPAAAYRAQSRQGAGESMKILALSDQVLDQIYSPQVKERYGDVSLVLGCGDLPMYYLEYVVSMLNVPFFHIPGNHDLVDAPGVWGRPRQPDGPRACGDLDGRVVCEQGLLIAGLGGSVRYRPDGDNQYTQSEMRYRMLRMTPRLWRNRIRHGRALDILITHAPPLGVHDGADPAHVGFKAFHRFIEAFRPRYLLHGHSHIWRRDTVTTTQVGPTTVINVCPARVLEIRSAHD